MFRAVVLADGDEIGVDEIPQIAAQSDAPVASSSAGATTLPPATSPPLAADAAVPDGRLGIDVNTGYRMLLGMPNPTTGWTGGSGLMLVNDVGDIRPLEDIEAEVIRFAVSHYRGQMSEVARKLQIGRSTLYRKLDSLGIAGATETEAEPESGVAAE